LNTGNTWHKYLLGEQLSGLWYQGWWRY